MPSGAIPLRDYPSDRVKVLCRPCGREGAYSLAGLMRRHGGDMGLPEVLARITADCPKREDWRQTGPCQAHYPDISARPAP